VKERGPKPAPRHGKRGARAKCIVDHPRPRSMRGAAAAFHSKSNCEQRHLCKQRMQ
jgi:hypothetical protein